MGAQTDDPRINYLTIFRDPHRDRFLAENRGGLPFFDPTTRAWIVTNPDLCKEALSSSALAPAPAVEGYRDMPAQFADDFASTVYAFDHVPLCMHGDPHSKARRLASEFIVSRREALEEWLERDLDGFLSRMLIPGRVEMMGEVIVPLVRGLISTLVDAPLPAHLHLENVSTVFDKSISMSRRRRADTDIGALRAHLKSCLPTADEADIGMRLSLIILGKDATTGTLAESLHAVFAGANGRSLDKVDLPPLPPQTGVPFVERIAVQPAKFSGWAVDVGERIRIFLQTYSHEGHQQHHRFFGAGAHACLGRPLSTDLWDAIVRFLSTVPLAPHVFSYRPAQDSYVFNVPKAFEVEMKS